MNKKAKQPVETEASPCTTPASVARRPTNTPKRLFVVHYVRKGETCSSVVLADSIQDAFRKAVSQHTLTQDEIDTLVVLG